VTLFPALSRILLLVVLAALLGWQQGYPMTFVACALLGLALYWAFQMWRLQRWLQDPASPPDDAWGLWGTLFSRIYRNHREVTRQRDQLQARVDYLVDSFSSMRDGVVIIDTQGVISWCNARARELLQLRFPQDRGQAIQNLVRLPAFSDYLHGGDFSQPLQFSFSNGTDKRLEVSITRFAEDDLLLFFRDVTALVRLEVTRRDFVDNVSHELRSPLTVISGYLDTLLNAADPPPERYEKPFRQMAQQAQRMENLLHDLLWLSRIESAEQEAKTEPVDVCSLLQELQEELNSNYPDNQVILHVNTRDRIPGNYRELYSAVSNLVLNAFRYSPGDCPVQVTWEKVAGRYRLAVEDRGTGIDPVHIPRLTERFYRVDESRSPTTGGTGLGLAIVKHVALAHAAELTIDSKPGQGSCFALVFPAAADAGQNLESGRVAAAE
jgi:two-component system phosphate regulon sensor histidine kinase PhoR